jgi:hypothetical protein
MRMTTYLVYYTNKDGYSDGYEVFGYKELKLAMKWLHSDEVKATDITIFKEGPDFENNKDDIIECHQRWWK